MSQKCAPKCAPKHAPKEAGVAPGPEFFSTRTSSGATSRSPESRRSAMSARPSNTTARPVCCSNDLTVDADCFMIAELQRLPRSLVAPKPSFVKDESSFSVEESSFLCETDTAIEPPSNTGSLIGRMMCCSNGAGMLSICSPSVMPDTVLQPRCSNPSSLRPRSTGATPPALWKSSMYPTPVGLRSTSTGVSRPILSNKSRSTFSPSRPAMAAICNSKIHHF